jgi:recombination protein RecT
MEDILEEMARKTIVKRASKYWPKAQRLDNAIHLLNEDEGMHRSR